jgi:hypothetical protein
MVRASLRIGLNDSDIFLFYLSVIHYLSVFEYRFAPNAMEPCTVSIVVAKDITSIKKTDYMVFSQTYEIIINYIGVYSFA